MSNFAQGVPLLPGSHLRHLDHLEVSIVSRVSTGSTWSLHDLLQMGSPWGEWASGAEWMAMHHADRVIMRMRCRWP